MTGAEAGLFELLRTQVVVVPFVVAFISGFVCAGLHQYNRNSGDTFIREYAPDDVVFNVFVVFSGLIASMRTGNALSRYAEAAAFLHKLNACWFDAASTLIAFCRASEASADEVSNFEHTLIRLISLLSSMCLDGLQHGADGSAHAFSFEVLGASELDDRTHGAISQSEHKVESVFQMIQQLVVDGMQTKVLSLPPPILTRSFQELGAGLMVYHEAKKLACVPLPKAYSILTATILISQAFFVPWMVAQYTRGIVGAWFYTFFGVFTLWFVNFVANALDNPFQKAARTLDPSAAQRELNCHLLQTLDLAHQPAPRSRDKDAHQDSIRSRQSFCHFKRSVTSKFGSEKSQGAFTTSQPSDSEEEEDRKNEQEDGKDNQDVKDLDIERQPTTIDDVVRNFDHCSSPGVVVPVPPDKDANTLEGQVGSRGYTSPEASPPGIDGQGLHRARKPRSDDCRPPGIVVPAPLDEDANTLEAQGGSRGHTRPEASPSDSGRQVVGDHTPASSSGNGRQVTFDHTPEASPSGRQGAGDHTPEASLSDRQGAGEHMAQKREFPPAPRPPGGRTRPNLTRVRSAPPDLEARVITSLGAPVQMLQAAPPWEVPQAAPPWEAPLPRDMAAEAGDCVLQQEHGRPDSLLRSTAECM